MAFSRDPYTYHEEERTILLRALNEDIRIQLDTKQQVTYMRHRLYALRKAIVDRFDASEQLRREGKKYQHLQDDLIMLGDALRSVSMRIEGTTLIVGKGQAAVPYLSRLREAIHASGGTTHQDKMNARLREAEERLASGEAFAALDKSQDVEPADDPAADAINSFLGKKPPSDSK